MSNTVFEVNVAVLTGVAKFDENGENTVAVSRNNLLGKWYISFNYPFWKIKEYDSSAEVEKAVHSGEADCFVVKAGQSLKTLANSKMHSVFLTKSGDSCFAVTRENTTLKPFRLCLLPDFQACFLYMKTHREGLLWQNT